MLHSSPILLIDEDFSRRQIFTALLESLDKTVLQAQVSDWESLALGCKEGVSAIVIDASLPLLDQQLYELTRQFPFIPLVLLCDQGDQIEYFRIQQTKNRQFAAYLRSPIVYEAVIDALYRCQMLQGQKFTSSVEANLLQNLAGSSQKIQKVRELIVQVADKEVSVLIDGQSGTEKEVVARHIHEHSMRAQQPFVPMNCGAIAAELLESELFGYEKGAFPGAMKEQLGRFELAEGGTLFLDEIESLPLPLQARVLRVLQGHGIERVGGHRTIPVNVRVLAAANQRLSSKVDEGHFREDLYYRLNVFPIVMPALSERIEDLPMLINHSVLSLRHEGRPVARFNSEALAALAHYAWPGDVRELFNLVERMAILYPAGVVGVQELPVKFRSGQADDSLYTDLLATNSALAEPISIGGKATLLPKEGLDLREYLQDLECSLIQQALDDSNGVVVRAAEKLKVRRTTLVEKIRKYGLAK